MSEEFSVNGGFCVKAIRSTGMRASGTGRESFRKAVNDFASKLAKKSAELAEEKKKKTIMDDDVESAVASLARNE